MALLKENVNNLIIDDLDKRNQNWTTIEDSLELKADITYVDNKVKTDVPSGAKFTDTNTTYSEITTAEIDTGTSSALRTITARRLKYLLDKIVALFPTKTSDLTNDSGFITSAEIPDVDTSNLMPKSGGVLGNYSEKFIVLNGNSVVIDLSLGNVFRHPVINHTTYSITNAVSGQAHSFTLIVETDRFVRTLTFPASVKWQGGEIPDMTAKNKTYVLTFMTIYGGSTWLGMFGGEF